MSDSVLDRIRQNRNRQEVPTRDDPLVALPQPPEPVNSTIVDSANVEIPQRNDDLVALSPSPEPVNPTIVDSDNSAQTETSRGTLEELKAELTKFPEMHRHSAIVLEKSLDQELTRFCKDQGITVEVFLEAAWTQVTTNPALKEQIVVEAKRRYAVRKRAGKLRRLITMLGEKS
jgi:hypothetical protein